MTRPSDEIEREVEAARGDLDRTVEALKGKMSPGQLIDELTQGFKGGAAGDMMTNLGAQARENPMALAMIGAGMAWLMMGKSSSAPLAAEPPPGATGRFGGGPQPLSTGATERSDGASSGPAGSVGHAAGGLASRLGEAASDLKEAVSDRAGQAVHGAEALGAQAAGATRKAVASFDDILRQEPLIVGAFGLALGVAVGAALPSTPMEDRTFGAARDGLVESAGEKLSSAAHDVVAAGSAALASAKDEAESQGLMGGDDGSLVDKAAAVVRAGVEAGRDELGGSRTA